MSIEARPAFHSRNLQAPRLNQKPLSQTHQIRFGQDTVCLSSDFSPEKKSTGFFGSIGSFIKNTLNFIFIKPWRWLGEQLGLIKKHKQQSEANESLNSAPVTSEPQATIIAETPRPEVHTAQAEPELSETEKRVHLFHANIQQGDIKAVSEMLKANPELIDSQIKDENAKPFGNSALATSVLKSKDANMVKFLLKKKPELIYTGQWSRLHSIPLIVEAVKAEGQNPEVIKALLSQVPEQIHAVEARFQDTLLHLANSPEMVRMLLEEQPDSIHKQSDMIHRHNFQGQSVLHTAKTAAVARVLLSKKPSLIHETDRYGRSVLDTAIIHRGEPELIDLILEEKPELARKVDDKGQTVLHKAANVNLSQIIDSLVKKDGSLLNAVDDAGNTAMHLAAKPPWRIDEQQNPPAALEKLLHLKPALANMKNAAGQTPLDIAKKHNYKAAIELLSAS